MKKLKFGLLFLLGFLFQHSNAQIAPHFNNHEKTREAYFFISDLETASDVQELDNYLSSFASKIVNVTIDLASQMCTVTVKSVDNENIQQLIYQAGYKGFSKNELPPPGFKYVYSNSQTWKLVEIQP